MKTKIWYSVENCGDGSAYPRWMESKELAELHQRYMNEEGYGWGESCTGWITIESEGPIKVLDEITTIESMIEETKEDMEFSDNPMLKKKMNELKKMLKDKKRK